MKIVMMHDNADYAQIHNNILTCVIVISIVGINIMRALLVNKVWMRATRTKQKCVFVTCTFTDL